MSLADSGGMVDKAQGAGDLCWLYTDGRHYDAKYTWLRKDIPFYIGQARKYGDPVLELACGTGRITIPLAEKGLRVTGIDLSPEMLAEARKKAAEKGLAISWVEADIRDFSLPRKYNLILFPFNSIAHLTEPWDLEACFKRVRRHLSGRGRFIIQMFNPDLKILQRGPARRHVAARYPDPDGRGIVTITESNHYDRATQMNHLKWEFSLGKKRWTEDLDMRIYFPREMDALLMHNGFRIEHKYGDFDRSPFKSESPNHILVCRAK
jgi:SAM-dependent methyltransferase